MLSSLRPNLHNRIMSFLSPTQKKIVDHLAGLADDVEARMMLGTVALFAEGQQFGVLDDDRLYLRVDEETRPDFVDAGTTPYSAPDVEQAAYLEVPEDIIDDNDLLAGWVLRAIEAAD